MIFGVPAPPKNERKWLQKGVAAATGRQDRLGSLLGSMLERWWPRDGAQNRSQKNSGSKLEFEVMFGRILINGLWEVVLETSLRLGERERKTGTNSANKHRCLKLFLHALSYRYRVHSVRLGARRRNSTTAKTDQHLCFLWWNLRKRHLRAQRDNP